MRIQDLLIESKQDINEAPVGLLKKAGLGIKKVFGSGKAAGELETGNVANQLKKEYMMMLGKTGQEPEAASVITFLKSKGYPTTSASSALGVVTAPQDTPAGKQAARVRQTKQAAAAKAAQAQMKAPVKAPVKTKPVAKTVSAPTQKQLAPNAPNPKGGVGAFDQMAQQLAKKAEPKKKLKAKVVPPEDDNPNIIRGTESIDYDISEAVSDQVLDMAFLKAAQEKAKAGPSATAPASEPTGTATPGLGAMAKAMAAPRDDGSVGGGAADVMSGLDLTTLKSAIARVLNQKPLTSQETASLQRLLKNLSKEG